MRLTYWSDVVAWLDLAPPGAVVEIDRFQAALILAEFKIGHLLPDTPWHDHAFILDARDKYHQDDDAIQCLRRCGSLMYRTTRIRLVDDCEPPLRFHVHRDPLIFGASA